MDMRVLLFANNWVGWQVARCLRNQGDQIVGLVIHPEVRRKYGTQIVKTSQVAPENLFTGTELSEPSVLRRIAALKPELGVSAFFGYILKQHLLDFLPRGCVNIHSSLLPYNRGGSPHVWGIVEGTPAGVTLHHIDPGIDTGDIIAQRPVPVEQADTGLALYRRLENACVDLFDENWPMVRDGSARRVPQPKTAGSSHRARDQKAIEEIDLDRTYTGRELIDKIRALTEPLSSGAYFRAGKDKVYLRVELQYEEDPGTA